jgi:hypothetical protein
MRSIQVRRATGFALAVTFVLASGAAASVPADGLLNHQEFAYVDHQLQLDDCRRIDAHAALIGGDHLKGPIGDGAPGSWSDLSITFWIRDDCAGTVTELTGFAVAPLDLTTLERAAVENIIVAVVDVTGDLELDVVMTYDWTVAGPATSVRQHDVGALYFREERIAPAEATGTLQVTDADGDVWPGGFTLGDSELSGAWIGQANEIQLCCP